MENTNNTEQEFKRKRMSKKMLKEMDNIADNLRNVIELNSSCIHLIPDYYKKLLVKFDKLSKEVCARGWDFGYNTYWYAGKLKDKLDKLEVLKE